MSRRFSSRTSRPVALAACLLSLALAVPGWAAATYPPGPGNCCPDTLTIINVQNPLASPHPSTGDVVLGVGGIITGFAGQSTPFGFYMQMKNGLPYSGIGVFTGKVNHGPGTATNLQLGDSVVVYGKVKSFQGAIAIGSLNGGNEVSLAPSTDEDVQIRIVSHGNPIPPFHVGTTHELEETGSNPLARPWDGMLVRVQGPLQVVMDITLAQIDGALNDRNHKPAFQVVDLGCPGPVCDTVLVDCSTLTTVDLPPPGTILSLLQGCFDVRESHQRVFLRSPDDLVEGNPPVVQDAFPTYDNELAGSSRIDSLVVVFDKAVEKTSAELTSHYVPSSGTIDGARRLDAPEDNRVVLQIHGAGTDGDVETITIGDVASLADGSAMPAPQTLTYYNGVLELEKVRAPDPIALAGNPCADRSRFSGAGSDPGLRASFTGTVTGGFGSLYTLQGTTPLRGGLWVQSPVPLTLGHAYILAGALEEVSGETQGTSLVYVRDLGIAPGPNPILQSVHVLIDPTCDAAQLFLTGLDFDGMLVNLDRVVVTATQQDGSFYVATPGADALARPNGASLQSTTDAPEQILIASTGNFSFAAQVGGIVSVTGVLGEVAGAFAIFPRSNVDIEDFGDQPTFSLPFDVSKSATASRDPDIVRGTNGDLFMAWGRTFHESVHSLSQDNTLNWSSALPIMHQGVQPALAVTPSNKFGVLNAGVDQLYFKQSTDGGFQMDPPVTPVDASPTRYPALTVGSGEHFHGAWERTGVGIFYARSFTGGADFSAPIPIALNSLPYETNSMARICATTGDNVFVFWQYDLPGEPGIDKVLFSRSLDGGSTFSTPRRVRDESNPLTSTVKLAFLGDAQVGPDGTVYVMGLQEGGPTDSIAFLKSTNAGGTFLLVGHLPPPAESGVCAKSFIVGPDGTIHALVGICGTALFYTRSTDGGHTWTALVNVTGTRSPLVGEPRGAKIILGRNGKPVIVWFAPVGASTEIYSVRQLN